MYCVILKNNSVFDRAHAPLTYDEAIKVGMEYMDSPTRAAEMIPLTPHE